MQNNKLQRKERLLIDICPKEIINLEYYSNVLRDMVELQEKFNCFYLISDYQIINKKNNPIKEDVYETAINIISSGVDLKKCNIAVQSLIPQHAELYLILNLLFQSLKESYKPKNLLPVPLDLSLIKATNILLLQASIVSVEEEKHIRLAKAIAKKFNRKYKEIFPVPFPVNRGGRYLLKKNNDIYFYDKKEDIRKKILQVKSNKSKKSIEKNILFSLHNIFNSNIKELSYLKNAYEEDKISDLEVKESLIRAIDKFISPIREKREKLKKQPSFVRDVLCEGSKKQERIAVETMILIKESVNMGFKRKAPSKNTNN